MASRPSRDRHGLLPNLYLLLLKIQTPTLLHSSAVLIVDSDAAGAVTRRLDGAAVVATRRSSAPVLQCSTHERLGCSPPVLQGSKEAGVQLSAARRR